MTVVGRRAYEPYASFLTLCAYLLKGCRASIHPVSDRNCLKSPNRLQIDALRVDNTGQKHHFLLVTAPKLPLRLCSQLLFRQFLEGSFSETGGSKPRHQHTVL